MDGRDSRQGPERGRLEVDRRGSMECLHGTTGREAEVQEVGPGEIEEVEGMRTNTV